MHVLTIQNFQLQSMKKFKIYMHHYNIYKNENETKCNTFQNYLNDFNQHIVYTG